MAQVLVLLTYFYPEVNANFSSYDKSSLRILIRKTVIMRIVV
jgi:hypothetical protein